MLRRPPPPTALSRPLFPSVFPALLLPPRLYLLSSIFDLLRRCAFATCALLCGGAAAPGQDLSPISFLQRPQINSAILQGTSTRELGKERRATTDLEDLSGAPGGAAAAAAGEASRGPSGRDIAEGIAFALVPRAIHLSFSTSLRAEYDSNITLGNSDPQQLRSISSSGLNNQATGEEDFIITGMLNTTLTWHSAGGSSIGLALGVGYRHYLDHSNFSGLVLNTNAPGGLTLSFGTGEVIWTLYDHVSYDNDPAGQPELSGVSKYSSFINSVGLEASWSPAENWLLRAGYERSYQSIKSSQQSTKRNSDALHFAATYGITPLIQTGLSASVTASRQTSEMGTGSTAGNQSSTDSDSTAFSIGPFIRGQITDATNVFLTAGVQTVRFDGSNSDQGGGGDPSIYGSLRIINNLTRFYSQTLEIGRGTQLGLLSDSVKSDYIRYSGSWNITHRVALVANLFAEKGEQSGGQIGEKFVQYGGGLTLNIPIRPTVGAEIGWRHTKKDSDQEGLDYSRDQIFVGVSWLF